MHGAADNRNYMRKKQREKFHDLLKMFANKMLQKNTHKNLRKNKRKHTKITYLRETYKETNKKYDEKAEQEHLVTTVGNKNKQIEYGGNTEEIYRN